MHRNVLQRDTYYFNTWYNSEHVLSYFYFCNKDESVPLLFTRGCIFKCLNYFLSEECVYFCPFYIQQHVLSFFLPMEVCKLLLRDMLPIRDMTVFCRLRLGDFRREDMWARAPNFWTRIWLIALEPCGRRKNTIKTFTIAVHICIVMQLTFPCFSFLFLCLITSVSLDTQHTLSPKTGQLLFWMQLNHYSCYSTSLSVSFYPSLNLRWSVNTTHKWQAW